MEWKKEACSKCDKVTYLCGVIIEETEDHIVYDNYCTECTKEFYKEQEASDLK